VVVDAGMEQARTRDWVITKLAVRERTGRLSRRGPVEVFGWDEIEGLTLAEVSSRGQGAEQLLGQGDMLYMAGGGRISRVPGPFCSDEEVANVVRHLKSQGTPPYLEAVTAADDVDVVLIAGKGHENYQEFADHTVPFEDIQVARRAIESHPVEFK